MKEPQVETYSVDRLGTLTLAEVRQLREQSANRRRRTRVPPLVPQERGRMLPLSFAQERLWFLDQLGLVGPAYNMKMALKLEGRLNVLALEHSFAELIRRHESLRTHFESVAGSPIQVIDPPGAFALDVQDLSGLQPSGQALQVKHLSREEAQRPFDLTKGPLLRASLLKLAEQEHVLFLTIHHIACDGWSLGVLNRELSVLYSAYAEGQPSPLPELPVQYADYAIWQRNWLQGDVLQSQLNYWREQLKGAPPQLELPTDRPRPAVASYRGALLSFTLPAELRNALEKLAREEGATPFMVALAAYQILLSRYSGQQDVVVGSAIAGRTNAQTEGMIGFFVNTLILRTDLSGNPSFRQLLARAKEVTLGAYADQDLPFEKLVMELRPERNLTRQPIFQVAFALQNAPGEQLQLPGLSWTRMNIEHATALFDLTLHLLETDDGLQGLFEYATDLFDQQTIERMATQFRALLEGIVAQPDRPIRALQLLRDSESQELLRWRGAQTVLPPDGDVISVLERHARVNGDSPAVRAGERLLTYRELNASANRLSRRLREHGVQPGDRVGVCMQRGVECIVAFYAIVKAGAVYVPLDPAYPAERLNGICRDADIRHLLVAPGGAGEIDLSGMDCIVIDESHLRGPDDEGGDIVRPADLMAPAYAIYTSGSTGRPKGVLLHHLGLANVIAAQRSIFKLSMADRVVQLASISFDASVFEFMLALGAGACLVSGSREELLPGPHLTSFLRRHGISVVTITPSALASLVPGDLPSLGVLIVAGEELPPELARAWLAICRVFNAYGPTEATIWVTTHECSGDTIQGRVPIGRPIDNAHIHLLDDELRPVSIGETGELCVGGPGVALGYINRPDLTAERFIDDPYCDQGRIYRTGDLARWRTDGALEFVGRRDSQVKIRGYRIEPAEIEAVLLEHPAVKQAVVLAREDSPGERRLVSYVVGDRSAASRATSAGDAGKLRNEIVSGWETLYEQTYGAQNQAIGPSFVGWNSSYTGRPIPEAEMQEWLDCAVGRIRTLRPKKLLEIGCGMGLLLQHLAPECAQYVGTDISTAALLKLRQWLSGREDLKHVELLHRSATELRDLRSGSFDTVVMNSVVQYFPDIGYLRAVLEEAVRLLSPGGKIFIGDVRHLGLLPMFHSAVQLGKAAAAVSAGQLRKRIARAIAQEKELVIDPQFFRVLPGQLPGISAVDVRLKQGRSPNELMRYRYDVVLYTGEQSYVSPPCELMKWGAAVRSTADLESLLRERRNAVRVTSIPNGHLAREAAAQKLIETSDERVEAGALRRQLNEFQVEEIDPEDLREMAQAHGYDARVLWSAHDPEGRFDLDLVACSWAGEIPLARLPAPEDAKPWSTYANDPLEASFRQQLVPQLREYLKERLPEYMIPSAWVTLKELPLTPSGKVNRRALPLPQNRSDEMGEYIEPRTRLERTLAGIWAQVLRVDQVGLRDNFFELGGHSLLIVQMMERLRQAGLSADVRTIYASPTLADLARALTGETAGQFEVAANCIPPECEAITPEMLTLVELEPEHIALIERAVPGGARNIQDIYPLAPLQEGILFHHLLNERGGDAYARSMLLALSSRERLEDLIHALQHVIDRHDVLRTAVLWEQLPRPVQVVCRHAKLPVQEVSPDRDRDPLEELRERMGPKGQRLDLRQAPLMRLQIAPDAQGPKWYALLETHHLVCDNESAEVMLAEVKACLDGRAEQLPEPVPYRNHVAQALAHARVHDAEAFFRSRLGEIDEPTAPFGLLDVHGDGSRIVEARQALDAELARRLRAQARRLNVSPATLFHAGWALVVSRTSARDDVVFGTVLLGRLQGSAGAQRILGMFINTLPLRLRLHVTVSELIEQTKRELGELLNHEQASLAVAQRCSAISGSAPLFSTLLNYRHSAVDLESEFGSAAGVSLLAAQGATNYPIVLSVDDRGDAFVLEMETERRIDPDRMLAYTSSAMQSLVDALERAPQTPVPALSVLPESERYRVLEAFNATEAQYPEEKLIHELFEEQVERTPDAVAVVYEGQQLTYAGLNRKANQLARYLMDRGVGRDQLVALCVERGLDMVVGLLGILKAGGAYVPLDPAYPPERMAYMLKDSMPKALLIEGRLRAKLPDTTAGLIALDEDWTKIAQNEDGNFDLKASGLRSHHLAYVIYTSGSTGQPKGVMIDHRSVVNLWQGLEQVYRQASVCRRIALNASFNFDASVQQLVHLLSGRTIFITAQRARMDAALLLRFLRENEIEGIDCTPSQLKSWISAGLLSNEQSALRFALVGGEPIDAELWDTLSRSSTPAFFNVYGPTECAVDATVAALSSTTAAPHIGRPLANRRIYILDRSGQPAPIGVAGEIYIGGAGVARGYLNRAELTAERFLSDPFSGDPQARMYRTGDLGRWRPDGTIEYLGRNDNQVKIRGYRIELGEIEAQLTRHAQVKEAAVVAREDIPGEKRLVAYVVPKGEAGLESAPTAEALRSHLKALLPEYMVPAAFVMLERLPLTSSGKLDRRTLPVPELGAYGSRLYEAPQGEVEEILAGIWQGLLRVERVGRLDNFFELGGHSLLIVQMLERLRRAGLSTNVRSVFESPTLAHLASVLKGETAEQFEVPPNLIPPDCAEITPQMLPLVELEEQHIAEISRWVPGGAVNIQDIYPLAPLQEGILFHHLLNEQGGDAYVASTLLAVSSRERLKELIGALQGVIDRQDVLRTAILWERLPRPVQVVYRKATVPVEEILLDPDCDPLEQLRERMRPERQRFDLRQAPLMRLQIAPDPHSAQWYVLLQLHHIVGDNTSQEIVISEVVAHLEGRAQELPAVVPYRNHVAQALTHAREHDAEGFFRSKFGEIDEPTAPFGLLDVHGDGSRTEEAHMTLDAELARRVRNEARRLSVSAATMFHAAWALVVSRTSGREDVVYGTVLLGRMQGTAGVQRILGMFINTLPLRLRLRDVTARELVEKTQRELVEILNHEQASLALAQRCSSISGSAPLFTALLNYRHGGTDLESAFAGAPGMTLLASHGATNYPIVLSVDDLGEGFVLDMKTDRQIDPRQMSGYMVVAMRSLVEALEKAPHTLALALEVLPESERDQVLEAFNTTQAPYPAEKLIHELFEEQAEKAPQAVALVCEDQKLTYAELNARSNQLAHYLRRYGVGPDQRAGICMERSVHTVVAILGILKAGGAYVPLDPAHPTERLVYLLDDASLKVVLTQQKLRDRLWADRAPIIAVDEQWNEIARESGANPTRSGATSEHLAYVMYTSGSTGQPKGVMVRHRNIVNYAAHAARQFDVMAGEGSLIGTSMNFDLSLTGLYPPLICGRPVTLCAEGADLSQELRKGRNYAPVKLTPTHLGVLSLPDGQMEGRIHTLVVGGEQLKGSTLRWWRQHCPGTRIFNHYGPTEATVGCIVHEVPWDVEGPVPIGRPISNTQIYILNEQRSPVPVGVTGEIFIGGAGVARGYINHPELTAERFIRDPFSGDPQARLYKTGDLGRWRADGTIEYLGRNDHQVKIRGFRIEPGEIEAQLVRHAQVKEAVVLAREDVAGEKRLVAYVTSRDQSTPRAEDLRAHLKSVLPDHMVPAAFVVLHSLPLTPNGKLDRRALPAPEPGASAGREYEAPQGEIEEALAQIWQEVLRVERVGRNDNFFELGGHSLHGMKLIVKVAERLDVRLSAIAVFQHPTVEELAQEVESLRLVHGASLSPEGAELEQGVI